MCRSAKNIIIITALIFIFPSLSYAAVYKSRDYALKDARIIASGGGASSLNYSIRDVRIGNITGGKAASERYILRAFAKRKRLPPSVPTVNAVTSPTNASIISLTGTKDKNTSIRINGYMVVSLDNKTTWSCSSTLSEGNNYLIVTAVNCYRMESDSTDVAIFLDTSAPAPPIVADDGDFTSSLNQLNASWSAEDVQTGVIEYQYAIGTAPYAADTIDWVSAGIESRINCTGLSLIQGETYYVSVKAKNGAGSWSEPGSSNGIKVNQTIPTIVGINPPDGTGGYVDENINFMVNARDEDGDSLLYQFQVDGEIIRSWQSAPDFDWSTIGLNSGACPIRAEVSDGNGGEAFEDVDLYLFRKPISPPAP